MNAFLNLLVSAIPLMAGFLGGQIWATYIERDRNNEGAWKPVDAETPRGVRLLFYSRIYGVYAGQLLEDGAPLSGPFPTHWRPMVKGPR